MIKTIFTIIAFVLFAGTASAEPINFLGLDFSMSKDEMINTTENRDPSLKCDIYTDSLLGSKDFKCSSDGTNLMFPSITFHPTYEEPKTLQFSCALFNGCDFKAKEMRTAISDKYGITMEYSTSVGIRNDLLGYCGKGKDGDEICVTEFESGASGWVFLNKGSMGKKLNF